MFNMAIKYANVFRVVEFLSGPKGDSSMVESSCEEPPASFMWASPFNDLDKLEPPAGVGFRKDARWKLIREPLLRRSLSDIKLPDLRASDFVDDVGDVLVPKSELMDCLRSLSRD